MSQDALGERFGLQLFPGATSFLILPRKAGRAKAVAHILQADEFETGHKSKKVLEDDVAVDAGDDDVDVEAAGARAENARLAGRKASVPASAAQPMQLEAERQVSASSASRQLTAQFDYVLS
jgi:hypothetical protein